MFRYNFSSPILANQSIDFAEDLSSPERLSSSSTASTIQASEAETLGMDADFDELVDAIDIDALSDSESSLDILGISNLDSASQNSGRSSNGSGVRLSSASRQRLQERSRLLNQSLYLEQDKENQPSQMPEESSLSSEQQHLCLMRAVGSMATWSISSATQGYDIHSLRDDNSSSYWQSQGMLPHCINLRFMRPQPIAEIHLMMDYLRDKGRVPATISIRYGNSFHDLREAFLLFLPLEEGRCGWYKIYTWRKFGQEEHQRYCLKTRLLQIAILYTHDLSTHECRIGGIKVFGPASVATPRCTPMRTTNGNDRIMMKRKIGTHEQTTFAEYQNLLALR